MTHHTDSQGRTIPVFDARPLKPEERPTIKEACERSYKEFKGTLDKLAEAERHEETTGHTTRDSEGN